MLEATRGVNTHRGAIFGVGLLCAAAGLRATSHGYVNVPLGWLVAARWGRDIVGGPRLPDSHGEMASHHYGAGGARQEAARGFPSVYEVGLPALRAALRETAGDASAARVQVCFALIAKLEDTNLLYRGGVEGLHYAQQLAQRFLDAGGVRQPHWQACAQAVHHAFVERRLSPGGAGGFARHERVRRPPRACGELVAVILPALVPIYFVLLLGFTAGKRGIVKSADVGGLKTVVMRIVIANTVAGAGTLAPTIAWLYG